MQSENGGDMLKKSGGKLERFMKKPARTVLLAAAIVMAGIMLMSCSSSSGNAQTVNSFEGGKLYLSPSGSFYIAELNGTFHEMGRQYGALLKDQIQDFYNNAFVDYMMEQKGKTYEQLAAYGQNYYSSLSRISRDYVDGMAETCGLTREQTYMLSSGLLGLFENGGCSSLSAWGDYTPDGLTVTGRNLDLPTESLRHFSRYFNIVVMNPTGFPAAVANLDYIGGLFFQTAFNSKGIFLELQNGENADTAHPEGREFANDMLLHSLFLNTTSSEVDAWFNTNLPDAGLIMNGTFPDHATIYEWATFRVAARNTDGLISASNDYIDPSWHSYSQINFFDESNEGIGYTVTRRKNLLARGEANIGNITPEKMMEIFDTTIPDGGATFPEGGFIKTVYSVVVKPSELKLWLKVRGYSGWEEIDLGRYFHN